MIFRPSFAAKLTTLTVLLSALYGCGGGSTGAQPPSAIPTQPGGLPQVAQAEVINVSPAGTNGEIVTSPVLKKANGTAVTTLDELPEGLANSSWAKTTGSRLPLRVILATGSYKLTAPWTWTPANSGRSDSPVYIEAAVPGGVVISGALRVTVPVSTHQGAAKVTKNLADLGVQPFEQLWVNKQRATLARTPNTGSFYFMKKQVSTWQGQTTIDGEPVNGQVFAADPASIAVLNGLSASERTAASVVAVHAWTISHHRAAEWNGANELRVSPPSSWPFLYSKFGFAQRYYLENIASGLDAAGEWYLDASSKLSYIPSTTEKTQDLILDIPQLTQLVKIQGAVNQGKWVEYLNFHGMTFRHAGTLLPAGGMFDGQGALQVDSAIEINGARNIALRNCEISRVGGYAVWLRNNVRNATITGTEIYDTGAGGIKVGTATQTDSDTSTGHNTINFNRIHAIGHQFPGGIGVWVGQSAYNNIEDNLIGDTTYTAISVGWTWGYGTSYAHHNQINRNFIYNVIQGALGDGGAIYTLGNSPGTEVKGNVIKNVRGFASYGAGAWGLYNDEGSTDILMDSNVVVGTDSGGYLQHYGKDITVSNNVFAQGERAEIQVSVPESSLQARLTNNRLFPTGSSFIVYGSRNPLPVVSYQGNAVSKQYVPSLALPSECSNGCAATEGLAINSGTLLELPTVTHNGSAITLPQRLAPVWPANSITSTPSPAPRWTTAPTAVPKREFSFDASQELVGTTPAEMVVMPANRNDLVSVVRNSQNEKCLAFQDGGNFAYKWEPYSQVTTNFDTGTTTVTFTLKADATTEFIHEWRDFRGSPYRSGPLINFSAANGVVVNWQKVADLPIGQWITVTVTANQAAGTTWNMQIKYENGQTVSVNNKAPTSPDWTSTRAVFFISNATTASTPCLGKITISNDS